MPPISNTKELFAETNSEHSEVKLTCNIYERITDTVVLQQYVVYDRRGGVHKQSLGSAPATAQ